MACKQVSSSLDLGLRISDAVKYALASLHCTLELRPKQVEVLEAIYRGRDCFVWFPTGYGKSLCYQLLPFMFDHKLGRTTAPPKCQSLVVIISPLVALMVDQVKDLVDRQVPAAILSGNPEVPKQYIASEADILSGKYRLLYSTPEAIVGSKRWTQVLQQPPLSDTVVALVVDEVHCVYKWSEHFRPIYARIHELRAFVSPNVPLVALTATVTCSARSSLMKSLTMRDCYCVSVSPNKTNIYYSVKKRAKILSEDFGSMVLSLSNNGVNARRVIVYCRSRDMCSDLFAFFEDQLGDRGYYPLGCPHDSHHRLFGMYHSKTRLHVKEGIIDSLSKVNGIVRIVFATSSLGMGIDCAGVTQTIHYGAPRSIDDYFQESGRAGRGGEQSTSTIYWSPSDVPQFKDHSDHRKEELATVRRYVENKEICRRFFLLHYFDPIIADQLGSRDRSKCCDNCSILSE